ncbi:hypothetical protein M0804_011462 [Polistes exclamans]|nr:hypothetical protein M0804_011462 [Polistes exclamans]
MSSSSSSSFMSLVWKYLLVIFLLIEHGRTDMEEINNDPIALLEKYLKYCRTIYDTYNDEIKLGYCWIDYLLGTNDLRSDFISNIIENELMQLNNNNNNNNNMIDDNCDNNSKYCDKYLSYNNNNNDNNNDYSEYDINVNSSNEKQYYNDNNVTTKKNLNDTLTKRAMLNHQIDNLNNQSSNEAACSLDEDDDDEEEEEEEEDDDDDDDDDDEEKKVAMQRVS